MGQAERVVLAGFRHVPTGPELLVDVIGERPTVRMSIPIAGTTMTIRVREDAYCTGRYDLTTLASLPCPNKNRVFGSHKICTDCRAANGFNPAFYNVGPDQLSAQQAKYNEEPHVVYLAYFAETTIKVGIANRRRHRDRLLEQGARVAHLLAEVENADAARAVEHAAITRLGLLESVNGSRKREALRVPLDVELAVHRLRLVGDRVRETLGIQTSREDQTECLDRYYFPTERPGLGIVDLTGSTPPSISGRGLGLVGDILVMRQGSIDFMFGLKRFIAREVVLSQDELENPRPDSMNVPMF